MSCIFAVFRGFVVYANPGAVRLLKVPGWIRNMILRDLDGRNQRFRLIAFQNIRNFKNRFSRQKVMVEGS